MTVVQILHAAFAKATFAEVRKLVKHMPAPCMPRAVLMDCSSTCASRRLPPPPPIPSCAHPQLTLAHPRRVPSLALTARHPPPPSQLR